eukprot:9980162-Alexandrium_andersonii.AAC.1
MGSKREKEFTDEKFKANLQNVACEHTSLKDDFFKFGTATAGHSGDGGGMDRLPDASPTKGSKASMGSPEELGDAEKKKKKRKLFGSEQISVQS